MFEIEWKKEKSVYRNLLQIKGISHTLAKNISATLGISKDTKYGSLEAQKVEELNLLISNFKKKTTPFTLLSNYPKPSPAPLPSKGELRAITQQIKSAHFPKGNGVQSGEARNFPEGKEELSKALLFTPILSSLDSFQKSNIKMLISSGTLRGKRLKLGYPVRGQRTRSNGRTAKRLNRSLGV